MAMAIFPLLLLALLSAVVVAGVVLIIAGVRGRALWSSPYCVACKYDLRGRVPEDTKQCPECGADLGHPKAVGFLRQGRRPRLIWLGVAVLLSPAVLLAGLWVAAFFMVTSIRSVGPHNLAQQSNPAVLTHVQNNPDQPWGWEELANRIKAGTLTAPEAEQALQGLTTHMKSTKPNGWDQPMHWQDEFLQAGYNAGYFSDQAVFDFVDAYYGTTPGFYRLPRVMSGDGSFVIDVTFGTNWDLSQHGGIPIDMLWAIDTITIDGEPVVFKQRHQSNNSASGEVIHTRLEPGEHTIEVTLDAAYVDSKLLVGFNKYNAGIADWPQALKSWKITVKDTLTVLSETDQPVSLSTDPALDPGPDGVSVKHLVVQPERGQKRVSLELQFKEAYIGAQSYDVGLDLGAEHRDLGRLYYIAETNHRSYSGTEHAFVLDSLDPSITTATVTLTPNPRHVYDHSEIDKVWGKPIVFKDVPVQRYDLREGQTN